MDPFGEVLSRPAFGEETISIAELDPRLIAHGKYAADLRRGSRRCYVSGTVST